MTYLKKKKLETSSLKSAIHLNFLGLENKFSHKTVQDLRKCLFLNILGYLLPIQKKHEKNYYVLYSQNTSCKYRLVHKRACAL